MNVALFSNIRPSILKQALYWSSRYDTSCLLQSNGFADAYSKVEWMLAVGKIDEFTSNGVDTFEKLDAFRSRYPNNWIPGFFGYDLKNEIETLSTAFDDGLSFPDAYFFIPQTVLSFENGCLSIQTTGNPDHIYAQIIATKIPRAIDEYPFFKGAFKKRMSKEEYARAFAHMKQHIARGDIYEVNLCQEFYAENCTIDPHQVYDRLSTVSPTPFGCFFSMDDRYILSASPERFLAKRSGTLISQPIKGTARRGGSDKEDQKIKADLLSNPKEIAENVMIVDLVRNDLTRSAAPGSVAAERKLEVHSFKQVHQLVSTITCRKNDDLSDLTCIENTFPPGSMTGAPKISAMKLCDRYEQSKRGVYAGAIGYFAPDGDFDFNVVIRTLLYNATNRYLSFHTGGAITFEADADREYEECLLKAKGILEALGTELDE